MFLRTALHWAAKRGHIGICNLLTASGANKEALNNEDKKPADVAKNENTYKLLCESEDMNYAEMKNK